MEASGQKDMRWFGMGIEAGLALNFISISLFEHRNNMKTKYNHILTILFHAKNKWYFSASTESESHETMNAGQPELSHLRENGRADCTGTESKYHRIIM
jgi:hypothetical protein